MQRGMPSASSDALLSGFQHAAAFSEAGQRRLRCMLGSANCADLIACDAITDPPLPGRCVAAADYLTHCEGDAIIFCSPSGEVGGRQDCAAEGLHCASNGVDLSTCTTGVACAPDSTRCDGSLLIRCHPFLRVELREDCAIAFPGSTCVAATIPPHIPSHACQLPPSPQCGAVSETRCEGDRLVACVLTELQQSLPEGDGFVPAFGGPTRYVTDCGAYNQRCGALRPSSPNDLSCFHAPDAPCTDQRVARCQGDSVRQCVRDRVYDIPCASLGFRTCLDASGFGDALCVP